MMYSGQDYEALFNTQAGEISENAFDTLRHKNASNYRMKTIKSGNRIEFEAFPLFIDYNKRKTRETKEKITSESQQKLNDWNSEKKLIRLVDTNFTREDSFITLTYAPGAALPDEKTARKHIREFFRKVRRYRKKCDLDPAKDPLKYVYVIEFYDGDGRRTRVHHHLIMSGMDRQVIKSFWPHGRARVDELEPYKGTLTGLVKYITKQNNKNKQAKRWQASKNLKEPSITYADTKLSRRQAERLATDVKAAAPIIFGKLKPDYILDSCVVRRSDMVEGAYIYASMYKEEGGKKHDSISNNRR